MRGKVRAMIEIRNVIHCLRMGKSKRQIYKDSGVHRSIVREVHKVAVINQWLNPELPMPSEEEISKFFDRKTRSRSHLLDVHKEQLKQWDKEGLSSTVIQQLLRDKCLCDMQVIRRYRQKHFPKPVEPVMVRDTVPGRDLEIDFGELGKFLDDDQSIKRVWVFSLRLRHSRMAYREVVFDQTLQTFLMGHVHAFEYFNGVPENCIPDNLKAAVIRSTIDNDQINRSYQDLAEYYGFIIAPCLPRTPQHKGGVENDIKYVKRNFLSYFLAKQKEVGIKVPRVCDLIKALEKWNQEVADTRTVQGMERSPKEIFKSDEKAALKPLPKERWELRSWHQCTVRRDWRIMLGSAYYSVPFQLIGETVEVCVTASLVRIFHKAKEVALHQKATKKWEYWRKTEHAPPLEEAVLQCTRDGLLSLAEDIGVFTLKVTQQILSHPSVDKLKPIRHLLRLAEKYSKERLEKACYRAFHCKTCCYKSIKNILEQNLDSQAIEDPKAKVDILRPSRFARDPTDYKSDYNLKEAEEVLAKNCERESFRELKPQKISTELAE